MPAAHLLHVSAALVGLYVPGAHGVWSVEPVEHADPTGQSVHSLAASRPGVLLYVPAKHGRAAAAPAAQKLPAVQASQAVCPGIAWNVPPTQSVHVALFSLGAMVPGAHGVWSVEPVEHADPTGQSVHSLAAWRPGVLEYVPVEHGSGADAP